MAGTKWIDSAAPPQRITGLSRPPLQLVLKTATAINKAFNQPRPLRCECLRCQIVASLGWASVNFGIALSSGCIHGANCLSNNLNNREALTDAGRISFMPHSSASHHSSAVMAEVTSTIGMGISVQPIRSTRSLQLPSGRANSVTITVLSRGEWSKATAPAMLDAHSISSPWASISPVTVASGALLDTKITVPVRKEVCIDLYRYLIPQYAVCASIGRKRP